MLKARCFLPGLQPYKDMFMYPQTGIMVPSFRKEAQAMQASAAPTTV
jgi:hypothetical protein